MTEALVSRAIPIAVPGAGAMLRLPVRANSNCALPHLLTGRTIH